jgi:hypothetical protein
MVRVSTRASVLTVMLAFGALGSCSLFVDTNGLSSGDGDAAIEGDASSDALIGSDAKSPTDAGVTDGGDAAPTPFCASHPGHTLCYDFDESASLPAADSFQSDPGHLVIDSTMSVSPPYSLLGIYNAGDSNEQFQKNLTSTQGKVSWAIDLKFSASDLSTGQTAPLATDVPTVDVLYDHYFYLQTYFNSLNIGESATPADGGPTNYTSTQLVSPVPVDTWMHVEFTVDGNTGVITLSFNGTALPNNQAQFGFPNGSMQVTVGGFAGDLPATTNINIDNVLVDL